MELAVACVLQLRERFLHAQTPLLLDALRPLCWSPVSVEAALQCVLRLLHGCHHGPYPYWTAGPGALARSGADPAHEEAALPRYGTPMHPAEDLRACLQRLTQLRHLLFPGWQSTQESTRRFPLPAFVRDLGMSSAPSELPYAAQLVGPIADILVSMAAHNVTWAVEQLILPFLQLGWRRASAAYTAASMRALVSILDLESEFALGSRHAPGMARTQREVPALLAPHIEAIVRAAYKQVGLQRVGMRFSPLGLCTQPGAAGEPLVDEQFLTDARLWEAAFDADFGHFTSTSPRTPGTPGAATSPAAPTAPAAGPKALLLRLTMYQGTMPQSEDDEEMLHLSYLRCRHYPDHAEETSPLTLNPTLLWASHTSHAPARTLLRHETALARAQHEAQLEHTYTTGGYSKEEWSRLYSEAMSVLPVFHPGSIPSQLIVDSQSRCFLVRALVHPDDDVAVAAARALQQIMVHHAGLRVPVFKALLALLGRIPPSDVAVQATLLGQFCHLVQVWIAELDRQDQFNLGNASMLEPVEPFLAKMESEALIALNHPLASVRLPALQLLITARSLGQALAASHERTVSQITGDVQRKAADAADATRRLHLEGDEKDVRRHAGDASSRSERSWRTPRRGPRSFAGGDSQCGDGTQRSDASKMSLEMEELQAVNDALREEKEARSIHPLTHPSTHPSICLSTYFPIYPSKARAPPPTLTIGVRVADVFEDHWGAIRAAALRRLLVSDGDHVLQADSYRLPADLSLRSLAGAEHSIVWRLVSNAPFALPQHPN